MIPVTAKASILLAVAPVNRRKQFDGLIAHCRQELSVDLRSGTFVAFINRAKTMIRVLVFDATGQWLMTKRISRGRFQNWPTGTEPVSPLNDGLSLEADDIKNTTFRKPKILHHAIIGLVKGQLCPECAAGRLQRANIRRQCFHKWPEQLTGAIQSR